MLIKADARWLPIRSDSVDCVVTSPPYWGLRDYGSAAQIGLEKTPEAYVQSIVTVFREVWRVLKTDGTVWLNLGDSYAAGKTGRDDSGDRGAFRGPRIEPSNRTCPEGLKPKDLVGIPWRVAFALQADGWYLRSDIIWHKPNPMPESVTDRPTKAHEYLFLLAKSERYFYDAHAVSESSVDPVGTHRGGALVRAANGGGRDQTGKVAWEHHGGGMDSLLSTGRRNKRTVWTVASQPVSDAHFATMPEALVEPCILAGCPMGGLVLDPFIGSGTIGRVAERFGRRWIGTDLSYQAISRKRTAQRGIMW